MKKNDDIILELTDTLPDGSGVGRYNGIVVFVPGAMEGEVARVHIVKVLKNYCYGKLTELITPSRHRVTPPCKHFGRCGGCSLQHIEYSRQLELKSRHIESCFRKQQLPVELSPAVASPLQLNYRNKAQYPIGQTDSGELAVGMYARHSHRFIPIELCPLQPVEFREISDTFCKYATGLGLSAYSEGTHSGVLRHLYLRTNSSGELMLTVVASCKDSRLYELCRLLRREFSQIISFYININNERTNVILGKRNILVMGEPTISQSIMDIPLSISPDSFLQVNIPATRLLYSKAAESISDGERVLDMYCGAGSIGLSIAALRKNISLTGIELVKSAVENAQRSAEKYGISARFICADATDGAQILVNEGYNADTVILDPPRKGCDTKVLSAVCRVAPKKIAMISCNPATAARDCRHFADSGYRIVSVTPVDMFPQTEHVECVVMLTKI